MIKAIIFDLGKVLIGGNWKSVHEKIARKLEIPFDKVIPIIQIPRDKWSRGEITEKEFWQELEKKTGKKLPAGFKKDLWFNDYVKKRKNNKRTWKIASELKKRGFRLAILSNTTSPHVRANKKIGRFKKLRELGFKIFILSCEVGCRKPEPQIFKITIKRLKLPAQECVFIDDRLENIKTAKKMGIQGIHFKTPKQLRKELIKLGLL